MLSLQKLHNMTIYNTPHDMESHGNINGKNHNVTILIWMVEGAGVVTHHEKL